MLRLYEQVALASLSFKAAAPGPTSINASLVTLLQLGGAAAAPQALAASSQVGLAAHRVAPPINQSSTPFQHYGWVCPMRSCIFVIRASPS